MAISARTFVKARRDRAIGAILGQLETELQGKISPEEWAEVRAIVLDGMNGYHDSILDIMKSEDGGVRNEEIFALLTSINQQTRTTRARGI